MDSFSYSCAISALAEVIAADIPDNDQLTLLAALVTQLGDTLETIVAMRELEQK